MIELQIGWEGRSALDFSRVYATTAAIDDFRPVLAQIASGVIGPSVATNFVSGGRPGWNELAASTLAAKAVKGQSSRILVADGALERAAGNAANYKITKDELRAAPFGIDYWVYHQSGTPRMPQRVIMMLQAEDRTAIFALFAAYMRTFIDFGARQFTGGLRS